MFAATISLASLTLPFFASSMISRMHESEADHESTIANKYQKGLLQFFKNNFINELFSKTSSKFTNTANKLLQQSDLMSFHPNHAKRLNALQLAQKQTQTQTAMTTTAWMIACLGVLRLAIWTMEDTQRIGIWASQIA